jgi:hypothetical protein
MIAITAERKFRIRVQSSKEALRTPEAIRQAYFTGNEKTALHSAIGDIKAMGDGACFLVEKEWNGSYEGYKCGELIDGRYYPRNNF